MVKMIVTDVDGTIVGKDEILHDAMTSYVKQLKEKQIDYTIATGRCAGLVKDYVEQLGIEVPYIACNGGSVVRKGEVLAKRTIPLKPLRKVFETADEMGMAVIYSVDGMEYAYRETPFVLSQQENHNRYFTQPDFTEETWETLELEKVIVMAAVRDGSIHVIEELLKELPSSIEYIPYGNKAIDIQSAEATKENGVRELARLMNLSMDEILFVGDDLNDVNMIKAAGIG
ncbi:MAG: Cof-type HAD-IIB family hydrolase, partial [Lachnospiraceae bacterium]|nr:Cof-type HAD-IIB family hydrolase [Lachnospiraceae bacterium]